MNAPERVTAPKVEVVRGAAMTEYRIRGGFSDVTAAIEAIFAQYDGRGYGTRVHAIDIEMDGSYVARMSRANSSD